MKNLNFTTMALIVILLTISCNRDDTVYTRDNEEAPKKERLYGIKKVDKISTKAVSLSDKTWESGDIIRIKFLNGSALLQEAVKQIAATWLEYAWVKFEYVSGNADVKIGFDLDAHPITWSTIGTDCKLIPQNEPSVNFVDLEYLLEDDYEMFQGDVLRAFGHILGLGFENGNPASTKNFKSPAQGYLEDCGFSADEALELLDFYGTYQTNYTNYDKNSIMVLPMTSAMVTGGANANTELSDTDKEFIAALYPKIYFERVYFSSSNACPFSRDLCEVNNVIYGFSPGGIYSLAVNQNYNIQSFAYTYSMKPYVVDNLIYYDGDVIPSNGSVPRCFNTDNGTITNVAISWTNAGVIKGINGVTYFGCSNGLYYLDSIDGVIKNKPLYDINGTEIVNLPILKFLKDSAGIVYVSGTKDYHQYIFTIDNNTVECRFSLLWDANINLFASPSGKIYYTNTAGSELGYIENGNKHIISNHSNSNSYVNKDEKIYFITSPSDELFVYKNGQLNSVEHDAFSNADMYFIKMIPLKHSSELILLAMLPQELAFEIYVIYPDQDDSYAYRIPTEGIKFKDMVETSDGQIYFYGAKDNGPGLWKFNK
ncbi:MAG: hypothetical protein LBR10_01100 [Prevotellaceae bacterium]|nr:hypothetical protein [Prevotellaceae bacterium]